MLMFVRASGFFFFNYTSQSETPASSAHPPDRPCPPRCSSRHNNTPQTQCATYVGWARAKLGREPGSRRSEKRRGPDETATSAAGARLVHIGHGDVLLAELALGRVALGLAVLALEDGLAVLVELKLRDHALGRVDAHLHRRACHARGATPRSARPSPSLVSTTAPASAHHSPSIHPPTRVCPPPPPRLPTTASAHHNPQGHLPAQHIMLLRLPTAGAAACHAPAASTATDSFPIQPRPSSYADDRALPRRLGSLLLLLRLRLLRLPRGRHPGAARTASLLARDALDVDDPLFPVALDNLALPTLIRPAHHRHLVVLAHRHRPHLRGARWDSGPARCTAASGQRHRAQAGREAEAAATARLRLPAARAGDSPPLPCVCCSSRWAAAHMIFVPQL